MTWMMNLGYGVMEAKKAENQAKSLKKKRKRNDKKKVGED